MRVSTTLWPQETHVQNRRVHERVLTELQNGHEAAVGGLTLGAGAGECGRAREVLVAAITHVSDKNNRGACANR